MVVEKSENQNVLPMSRKRRVQAEGVTLIIHGIQHPDTFQIPRDIATVAFDLYRCAEAPEPPAAA